jgi:hypothetical protein
MAGFKLSNASSSPASTAGQPPVDEPLGLTVHSLPDATAAAREAADPRRVFGELIDPQRPLPDLPATRLDGTPDNLLKQRGQWLLVSVAGGACDAVCQQHLYLQRQVREGLGREKDRLDRVWLVNDTAAVPQSLLPALKDATVLRVDAGALSRWLVAGQGRRLDEHLYLVDPLGNWMMRFPPALDNASAARAKRDLERVLRATSSWDTPGRQSAP